MEKKSIKDKLQDAKEVQKYIKPGEVTVFCGDARCTNLNSESVDLVVTSPPYFNIKKYVGGGLSQIGNIADVDVFIKEVGVFINECFRILKPSGKLCINTGNVFLSRRSNNKVHEMIPLVGYYQCLLRESGFNLLNNIIWQKIGNVKRESNGSSGMLGKPYEPNCIIKNEIEYIIVAKKPGSYRKPSEYQRLASMMDKEFFQTCFQQIWQIPGSKCKDHPAVFPVEIPSRLIKMYSFVEDVILDPFAGSGTTGDAAQKIGRNCILIDCSQKYVDLIRKKYE